MQRPLFEFMKRAEQAPYMSSDDFMLKAVYAGLKELGDRLAIDYDPASPVSCDNALADRLFEGALTFLSSTGIYLEEFNQVVPLERKTLLDAVDASKGSAAVLGHGGEQGTLCSRRPEDGVLPWLHLGAGCLVSSERIATDLVEGYARVEGCDSVSIPALGRINGLRVVGGSPLEIEACIRSISAARQGLCNAGRPGLPILNLVSASSTAAGTIAASHPAFGLSRADGWLIDFLPELKVNFESLNRLAFVQRIGGHIGSTAVPILGGYAGGPAGTALIMTAYALLGLSLFQGDYHLTLPIHFNFGCNSIRQCLWVMSACGRAISRNCDYPVIGLGFAAAGPCTEMYFQEAAATMLALVPSGYAGLETPHPAKAALLDGITPLEAAFTADFARAVRGISGREANELTERLLKRYEPALKDPPQGQPYSQCFDQNTKQPTDEYLSLYARVEKDFAGLGCPLAAAGTARQGG